MPVEQMQKKTGTDDHVAELYTLPMGLEFRPLGPILLRIEETLNELLQAYRTPKRMLSVEEACAYLGIGTSEGYARLRSNVRTVRHGRRILVPREELDALIERAKRRGQLFD